MLDIVRNTNPRRLETFVSTTIPQSVTAAQEQLLDGIRQNQQIVLEAIRAWADAAQHLPTVPTQGLPSLPVDLPEPKELVAGTFDFAEKLLATQREFVEELLAAVPAPAAKPEPAPAAKATKA